MYNIAELFFAVIIFFRSCPALFLKGLFYISPVVYNGKDIDSMF